jgi:hypothetical protein
LCMTLGTVCRCMCGSSIWETRSSFLVFCFTGQVHGASSAREACQVLPSTQGASWGTRRMGSGFHWPKYSKPHRLKPFYPFLLSSQLLTAPLAL